MNVSNLPNEARTHRPADHPPAPSGKVGVLIVNLGTPEGTDYWSIRRYLQEFLSDRRVIETPRAIWLPILQVILLRRPHAKGRDYEAIWNKERDEGPLKTITRSQSEKLAPRSAISTGTSSSTGPCGMARRRSRSVSRRFRPRAATAFSSFPSIRNIAPLRPRPSATRRSMRCNRCAGSRRFASRRPITTIPSISKRSPAPSAPASRARFRTRGPARLLSRHSAGLFRQGRSLLLPLREDDAALARGAGHGARSACA